MIGERTGETYRLGDRVEVKLVEAAPVAGALRFELLSEGRFSRQDAPAARAAAPGADTRRRTNRDARRRAPRSKRRRPRRRLTGCDWTMPDDSHIRCRTAVSRYTAMKRGFLGRCPACGQGRLFGRFLKVADHCAACGTSSTTTAPTTCRPTS